MGSVELGIGDADCGDADDEGWEASCGGWVVGNMGEGDGAKFDGLSAGGESKDMGAVDSDEDGEVAADAEAEAGHWAWIRCEAWHARLLGGSPVVEIETLASHSLLCSHVTRRECEGLGVGGGDASTCPDQGGDVVNGNEVEKNRSSTV